MRSLMFVLPLLGLALLSFSGCQDARSSDENGDAAARIHGAGATFPAPLYREWLKAYQDEFPDKAVTYDVVGSGAGTKRFLAHEVDFGASDAALTDDQIAEVGALLIPSCGGSITIAYNPEGLPPAIKLSRDVYVDIFLGKIKFWNDERIAELNPESKLPALPIVVVTRSDSSGTTFAFTSHLSAISDPWKKGPGAGKLVDWPVSGGEDRSNELQAGSIARTPGGIGYVEYGTAQRAGMAMATLENKAGKFVAPSGDSGLATLTAAKLPENLRAFFSDPDGEDSYPIVTYTWLLLYSQYDTPEKAESIQHFVRWCLNEGQAFNNDLGYVQVPDEVKQAALAKIDSIQSK